MKLFQTIKMEGTYWGVFLMNPNDTNDRYLVTSTFDEEREAESVAAEFNRIAEGAVKVVETDSIPQYELNPRRKFRLKH
jgi:hypothetical protein